MAQQAGNNDNSPYQYGLGATRPNAPAYGYQESGNGIYQGITRNNNWINSPSNDADVQGLQGIYDLQSTRNPGTSNAEQQGLINMYQGRIGQKNALGQMIANNSGQESSAEGNLKASINSELGQGLRNTRENFNNRGLLYSGARVGGEQAVRSGAASAMASGIAGTKQDYANAKTSAQDAYAQVDLAQQQQTVQMASDAFNTANANSIARMQAAQALGSGVGSAAGTLAGYYSGQPGTPPGQPPQSLGGESATPGGNPINQGLVNGPQYYGYNPYQPLASSGAA